MAAVNRAQITNNTNVRLKDRLTDSQTRVDLLGRKVMVNGFCGLELSSTICDQKSSTISVNNHNAVSLDSNSVWRLQRWCAPNCALSFPAWISPWMFSSLSIS